MLLLWEFFILYVSLLSSWCTAFATKKMRPSAGSIRYKFLLGDPEFSGFTSPNSGDMMISKMMKMPRVLGVNMCHEVVTMPKEYLSQRKYLYLKYQPAFILQIQTINVWASIENSSYNQPNNLKRTKPKH